MKKLVYTLLLSIAFVPTFAQEKNKFALGGDLNIDSYPQSWYGSNARVSHGYFGPFTSCSVWMAYYIKNNYCVRLSYGYVQMQADYPETTTTIQAIFARQATFHDLMLGKNIMKSVFPKRMSGWLLAGAGVATTLDQISGYAGSFEMWSDEHHHSSRLHFYPTVQATCKYDVLPFAFAGAGLGYRYLYSDFQQLTFNLSVGFQF